MVDFTDIASDLEQERIEQALNNRQQFSSESNRVCEDCDVEIPEKRRAIGGVTLCIKCQTELEAKQKHFRD